jgi:AraC family transcriptional activator of pobA
VGQRTIPSYGLYGEPHRGSLPDCLHCETISDRSRLHDWHIRPHRHNGLHQFLWIEQGGVVVSTDISRHELKAPAAVMNAPTSVHAFEFEPGTEGYVVTVPTANLERALFGSIALLQRLERSIVLRPTGEAAAIDGARSILTALAEEYAGRRDGRAEALLSHLGMLALWFLRRADQGPGEERGRPQGAELVRRFLALLETRFREQRPLSFYARELGVSVTHLSRSCRFVLGLSALRVVHDRLVLEAKRSLLYTPATVTHVAEELGFVDPAHFTKFFTQNVGETPSAFRRSVRSAA